MKHLAPKLFAPSILIAAFAVIAPHSAHAQNASLVSGGIDTITASISNIKYYPAPYEPNTVKEADVNVSIDFHVTNSGLTDARAYVISGIGYNSYDPASIQGPMVMVPALPGGGSTRMDWTGGFTASPVSSGVRYVPTLLQEVSPDPYNIMDSQKPSFLL